MGCGAGWPTCASTGSGGCKLGGASRPPCRRPTASGTIRLCFKRLSAAASTWWRAGSGEWAEWAPAPAHYRCPFGCSTTTWPGGAAWCRAALGRGLVVVWLYERPGLAFPYPLRVHRVWCLPAAWLHSHCRQAGRWTSISQAKRMRPRDAAERWRSELGPVRAVVRYTRAGVWDIGQRAHQEVPPPQRRRLSSSLRPPACE